MGFTGAKAMSLSFSAHPTRLAFREALDFAYDSLRASKVSSALTALGMFIGTAALILVVSISLAGKQYVLKQIESIGVNWIFAEYQAPPQSIVGVTPDPLTIDDLSAILRNVPSIVAASPVAPVIEHVHFAGGRERDLQVLGVYPDYEQVRSLVILSGRFFDVSDLRARNKVALMTEKLAAQLYGSIRMAAGNEVKVEGLPFTVIGTFRERVNTFGQSELTDNTVVIPYTVSRFFTEGENVKQLYLSVSDSSMVVAATDQVKKVIQGRHRPESVYLVSNLTSLMAMAKTTARGLSLVLLLIAVVTLLVGGIGIMNIMLATVAARTHEIGIRKALGATNRAIRFQFLSEAVLISLAGGIVGIAVGLGVPTVVRIFTDYQIPISYISAFVALAACSIVGMLFGTVPAVRAAQLDPIESLHYE